MYHSAARVVHIDKSCHQEYIDYILDEANDIPLDIRPVVANSDYTIFVLDEVDFDRMMKHFRTEWLSDSDRSAATNKIIFKKADEIKRLEKVIDDLETTLVAPSFDKALLDTMEKTNIALIVEFGDIIKGLEAEIERLNKVIEDRDDTDFFNGSRIRNNN